MPSSHKSPLSYRDAGVDIERGEALVERIKPGAASTSRSGVMGSLGGFGGLFDLAATNYRDPVLVSSTDGVGTKLLLAIEFAEHHAIGFDLVAMCVNDVIVQGAEPLFFLDYFATGELSLETAESVINSIASACLEAGCALLGGETAEMPGMYPAGHYDLAGFCVGAVERSAVLDGSAITAGNVVLGLASSGIHSNGYSLVRKIVEQSTLDYADRFGDTSLGSALLAPTRIYVKSLLAALNAHTINGMAHITGGGLTDNLPRVMPAGLSARIDLASWQLPALFQRLRTAGNVVTEEMLRTFNCGIGMAVVVPADEADALASTLRRHGETVYRIGQIESGDGQVIYQHELSAETD